MPPTGQEPHLCCTRKADPLALSALVNGLFSLHDGPAYISELIAYGPEAVPALADLLLLGEPSSVSQPRQWAVETLGALGAYDVLLSYLRRPINVQSPVIRHEEEAVQNAAARELAACQSEKVYSVLLDCLRRHPLPGFIESIGHYQRIETAPYLIDCLEDDVCRCAAIDSLCGLGSSIRPLLVESAIIRNPPLPEFESPSSSRRRRCCARLLERSQLTEQDVSRLVPLLYENDADIVIAIAQALFQTPHFGNCALILFHLNRLKTTVEWWLKDELRALISEAEEKVSLNAHHSVLPAAQKQRWGT